MSIFEKSAEQHIHTLARRADAASVRTPDASPFWSSLIDCPAAYAGHGASPSRQYVLLRSRSAGERRLPLLPLEADILARIFGGLPGKVAAADLGVAPSTLSKWYSRGRAKLGLEGRTIPLPLVLAAQSWASTEPLRIDARQAFFEACGHSFTLLSTPRPQLDGCELLTASERDVVASFLEGDAPRGIAWRRQTSLQTVFCQLRSTFKKCKVSGRLALVRRGVDLGWFEGKPAYREALSLTAS